jgi:ribosomal protein RSM22 (predicted rRNA methylase)
VIEIPPTLATALSALAGRWPRRELAAAAARLSSAYRADGAPGRPLRELDAAAYAVYRMPATYAAVRAALAAAQRRDPAWRPRSVCDLGAGTGAVAWAVADAFGGGIASVSDDVEAGNDHGFSVVIDAVERDPAMARIGQQMSPATARVRWVVRDVTAPARPSAEPGGPGTGPDLAVLAYSLGELVAENRAAVVDGIAADADSVLIVEPGTPRGFATIVAAREALVRLGLHVLAPCPHSRPCPVEAPDWCHFAQRLPRSAAMRQLKGADLAYEDEKFSYVLVRRADVADVTESGAAAARIVRHPRHHGGHTGLRLCDPSGELRDVVVSKRDREAYRRARKAEWGHPWPGGG